jgi:rubrerythrin
MNHPRIHELLLQALETERGGIQVYETAIRCAVNPDLNKEWTKYLKQTQEHERALVRVFKQLGLDPMKETAGRALVRAKGKALVATMEVALGANDPVGAQVCAAECVVDAETKDHANWSLLSEVANGLGLPGADALREACDQIEDEEDEHLYHTQGWARELWLDALGLDAKLPPPEEVQNVKSAAAAAKAKKSRKKSA